MQKVLITGTYLPHVPKEIEILSEEAEVIFKNTNDKEELFKISKDVDVVMTDVTKIDKEFINNAKNLKAIVEYGVGYDNIDIKTAGQKGITVSNVPDGYIKEVSEHAITLILSVSRQIIRWSRLIREHKKWDFNVYDVYRLYGKTIGLIGCGKIGSYVAKFSNSIGMNVIIYDPYLTEEKLIKSNIEGKLVDFNTLLKESDIISVHAPLTEETHYLIDNNEINQMKEGVILINVSRASIINESSLLEGLKSGKIFGLGLDVLENEPNIDTPLLQFDNVIITPHIGWKSEVAAMNNEMLAVQETLRFLRGEDLKNIVNRKYLKG